MGICNFCSNKLDLSAIGSRTYCFKIKRGNDWSLIFLIYTLTKNHYTLLLCNTKMEINSAIMEEDVCNYEAALNEINYKLSIKMFR